MVEKQGRMTLTFELAHFVGRNGHEQALLAERPAMVRALKRAFPDALAAWLTRQDDGSWLDIILWQSREAAEEAAHRIGEVAEARSWFSHIGASHGVRHVEVRAEHLFAPDRCEDAGGRGRPEHCLP
jgi:hypothetical protein